MQSKIVKLLEKIDEGYIEVAMPCNTNLSFGNPTSALKADINIHDRSFFDQVLLKGDIGFGECFVKGIFSSSNIQNLLEIITLNQKHFDSLFYGNILYSTYFLIKNLFRRNSLRGSKQNIESHYDLGNDFYKLWLDNTMSYSSGIYYGKESLKMAQHNKYKRILDMLQNKGDRILEIGSGWGGFIREATKDRYNVKGLTLSNEQKRYCDKLIQKKNLDAQVELQDYRAEQELFDNIVSIEMFEAVGKEYWQDYFARIKACLKKGGRAVIQTIVINDQYFKKYSKTSDFIRDYIFPGGFLPSPSIFRKYAMKSGLAIVDDCRFGQSYKKTLLQWLKQFNNARDNLTKLGYNEEFFKKWQFYLVYCAAGFSNNRTDVVQFCLEHE